MGIDSLRRKMQDLLAPYRVDEGDGESPAAGGGPLGRAGAGGKKPRIVRRHIIFFGRVQGVGFRYHLMHGARNYGLTGWVENLYDGTVEAEIQGPEAAISHVLKNLGNGSWIRIDGMESRDIPLVAGEGAFRVRGY